MLSVLFCIKQNIYSVGIYLFKLGIKQKNTFYFSFTLKYLIKINFTESHITGRVYHATIVID